MGFFCFAFPETCFKMGDQREHAVCADDRRNNELDTHQAHQLRGQLAEHLALGNVDIYNDLNGAVLTSLSFCLVTFLGSIFASGLSELWYGLGLVIVIFL